MGLGGDSLFATVFTYCPVGGRPAPCIGTSSRAIRSWASRGDGVELARTTVTVTTLGTEFLRDVHGVCVLADFPTPGETVSLSWQEAQQNFVLTGVE